MDRQLHIKVEEQHPLAVLRIIGFCAQLEVYKMKSEAEWQLSSGNRFLVLDLNELSFIDSAGIGALIQLCERSRSLGGQIAFACIPDSNIKHILEKSLGSTNVEFSDSTEDAVNLMRRKYGLGGIVVETSSGGDLKAVMERLQELEKRVEHLERVVRPEESAH